MYTSKRLRNCFIKKPLGWSLSFLLSLSLTTNLGTIVRAESPETAPPELKTLLGEIDAAANQKELEKVMQLYSADFTNSDGLNSTTLGQALKKMWQRYPDLKYQTQLQSWEKVGDELIAETVTNVQGTQQDKGREIQLNSTIKSRQYFKEGKLIRQEILTERTDLKSGSNPPELNIVLPEKVRAGEQYDFDVIVKEPLGNELLAGAALEEKIDSDRYLNPGILELELLQAGGLFKRGKAPDTPTNQWLSAIVITNDGITLVTQRVKVE